MQIFKYFSVLEEAVLLFWNSENFIMVSEPIQAIWRSNTLKEQSSFLQKPLQQSEGSVKKNLKVFLYTVLCYCCSTVG